MGNHKNTNAIRERMQELGIHYTEGFATRGRRVCESWVTHVGGMCIEEQSDGTLTVFDVPMETLLAMLPALREEGGAE